MKKIKSIFTLLFLFVLTCHKKVYADVIVLEPPTTEDTLKDSWWILLLIFGVLIISTFVLTIIEKEEKNDEEKTTENTERDEDKEVYIYKNQMAILVYEVLIIISSLFIFKEGMILGIVINNLILGLIKLRLENNLSAKEKYRDTKAGIIFSVLFDIMVITYTMESLISILLLFVILIGITVYNGMRANNQEKTKKGNSMANTLAIMMFILLIVSYIYIYFVFENKWALPVFLLGILVLLMIKNTGKASINLKYVIICMLCVIGIIFTINPLMEKYQHYNYTVSLEKLVDEDLVIKDVEAFIDLIIKENEKLDDPTVIEVYFGIDNEYSEKEELEKLKGMADEYTFIIEDVAFDDEMGYYTHFTVNLRKK